MPKTQAHWVYDLLTVLAVVLVSAFVFWALPAEARGAGPDAAAAHLTGPR